MAPSRPLLPTMATNHELPRTAGYKPSLAVFAAAAAAWVFLLVSLGAFTTTINAGMAFPDWPLSNGSLNPSGWLTHLNMFAEHAHRLSAGVMTILTAVLAFWLWRRESRRWLRALALAAVALVVAQAVVGGLRVLLDPVYVEAADASLGRLIAMLHACLAQAFACVLIALAVSCTRGWITSPVPVGRGLRRVGVACCALLFVQLGIGAVMRHSFAGLAITTFPWSTPEGNLLPAAWDFPVAIHFAHRAMACAVTVAILVFAAAIWRDRGATLGMRTGASALVSLLAFPDPPRGVDHQDLARRVRDDGPRAGRRADAGDRVLAHLARPPRRDRGPRRAMTEAMQPAARFGDYLALTKPRLSLLSVLTALVGYFAARPVFDGARFAVLAIGTSLAAGGVASLNQWMESDTDARMNRTALRPIPAGRIPGGSAFVLGWLMCIAALMLTFALVGKLAALFTLLTIAAYLGWYTPAKRSSRWSTEIGAIAGALPPLIGWSAAEGRVSALGWILFGIMFFWQIPHFMAIAWTYRRDYSAVNFPMLPVRDEAGGRVAAWSFVATLLLVSMSALPWVMGLDSRWYAAGAPRGRRLLPLGGGGIHAARRAGRRGPPPLPPLARLPPARPQPAGGRPPAGEDPMTVHDLPPIEAALNAVATVLITAGFIFIKRGNPVRHRACMLSAAVASALFLAFYVTYHALMRGLHTPFGGNGPDPHGLLCPALDAHPARGAHRVPGAADLPLRPQGRLREAPRLGAGHVPHLVLRVGDGRPRLPVPLPVVAAEGLNPPRRRPAGHLTVSVPFMPVW